MPELPGESIGDNQRRQMSGCGARTAAGSLGAVFELSDVERFGCKIITSSPSLITAPLPPAKGNSIGELVAVGPARAHSGRLGTMKTGEFSNAIFGEN